MAEILDELLDWLRIPSVSSGGGDAEALRRAAEWAAERVADAGGAASLVETGGAPIALGELPASRPGAPTVLIYGHYDVQGAGPLDRWRNDPFQPEVRDGRVWARGASDDKGNFLPLLHEACALFRTGELPVNIRVLVEGEEEVGSSRVCDWVRGDERGADVAVVFDAGMIDERTPALTVACRGLVGVQLRVRTAERDLHSGVYGGAALNAAHALHRMLGAVLPGPDGLLPHELRAGIAPPSEAEIEAWRALPGGAEVLSESGARPSDPAAAAEFWRRTGAETSLDINGIAGGDAEQLRTIVPAEARANFSIRLAPGQRAGEIAAALERLLRDAAPPGADVGLVVDTAEPAAFDPSLPALQLAHRALRRACETDVAVVRSGGTLPILSALAERRIPTVISGFALAADQIHAPNESYRLEALELGRRAARELYAELAGLDAEAPHA